MRKMREREKERERIFPCVLKKSSASQTAKKKHSVNLNTGMYI